ncbi:MAG: DUF3667 domain-containing protein [Luteimonas sp.]
MSQRDSAAAADAPTAGGHCENCEVPLLGGYCYACGQPVKGLVRHFTTIVGDIADTVFNYDSRMPRSLWPLFAKPAWLTCEYFAGRRVRYVSPVRLFVTLSIITFFIAQLMLSFGGDAIKFDNAGDAGFNDSSFSRVTTVAEVVTRRDAALADLAKARKDNEVPGLDIGLGIAEKAIRNSADARIAVLQRKSADGTPAPATIVKKSTAPQDSPTTSAGGVDDDIGDIAFNGSPWDARTNPLIVSWWPEFANHWLNAQVSRGQRNLRRIRSDPDLFKDAVLGAVPSTLFILLPVFALMLKLLYVFKRRLYMEHLIVALHSHAFLCLALLLMFGLMAVQRWLAPDPGGVHTLFNWVEAALWTWMPLYLLLMQKRVYGQGWWMTLLKYSVLGFCYITLLSLGAAFTMMFSVVYA